MTATTTQISITDRFIRDYEILKFQIQEQSPEWIFAIRNEAIRKFKQLGIPTRKNENWKYTSLEKALKKECSYNLSISDVILPKHHSNAIPDLDAIQIVTCNGHFVSSLSSTDQLPKGVVVCSFSTACEKYPEIVKKYFAKIAPFDADAMLALNTAFAVDGLFIYVPKNVVIQNSIHIQNIVESVEDIYYFQRNIFVIDSRAQASIVETYHAPQASGIWNEVTEIAIGENAQLTYNKLQCHISALAQLSHITISQLGKSLVNTGVYTIGSKWVRNTLHFSLDAENTETHLNGLYVTQGDEFVDNHTLVDHRMPNCYSNELYKGIMDGQSTAVFNGKVYVHKDAQKTNAYQSNKNIVLTNEATVYTKPELEIYADDVKCSHGATTGQLDREALFYLQSRGISEESAKALLLKAFMADVLNTIKIEPLKRYIEKKIQAPSSSPKGGEDDLD